MNKKQMEPDESTGEKLCEKCGSVMILEDNRYICPHCDAQIDFFGDDDEDIS